MYVSVLKEWMSIKSYNKSLFWKKFDKESPTDVRTLMRYWKKFFEIKTIVKDQPRNRRQKSPTTAMRKCIFAGIMHQIRMRLYSNLFWILLSILIVSMIRFAKESCSITLMYLVIVFVQIVTVYLALFWRELLQRWEQTVKKAQTITECNSRFPNDLSFCEQKSFKQKKEVEEWWERGSLVSRSDLPPVSLRFPIAAATVQSSEKARFGP